MATCPNCRLVWDDPAGRPCPSCGVTLIKPFEEINALRAENGRLQAEIERLRDLITIPVALFQRNLDWLEQQVAAGNYESRDHAIRNAIHVLKTFLRGNEGGEE